MAFFFFLPFVGLATLCVPIHAAHPMYGARDEGGTYDTGGSLNALVIANMFVKMVGVPSDK